MQGPPHSRPSRARGIETPNQRRVLDARQRILEARAHEITYQHTVFCQTSLPYRDPGDHVRSWEREQGRVSLQIEAGRAKDPTTGKWLEIGLPFGSKARLILMDLNQRALRTQSPTIDVGDSMTSYLARRLGLDTNGRNIRALKEQISRLSTALVRLAVCDDERGFQVNTNIVSSFDLWFPSDGQQRVLWPSVVQLSDEYFKNLVVHAVPLDERAISAIAHSAMALDLYTWLAQRLHRIPPGRPQFIPWASLKEQFGADYTRTRSFRAFFLRQLRQVAAVYPEVRLDTDRRGLTLYHAQPPVRRLLTPR